MSDPFIGEIKLFAANFAPRNWAFCDGQLLAISQNEALFSLLGTIYGGDGRTTFALPDLRGRKAIHAGNGPTLSPAPLGRKSGAESHTLNVTNLPSHSHTYFAESANGTASGPGQNASRLLGTGQNIYTEAVDTNENRAMSSQAIGSVGASQSVAHLDPYLGVNYIIALFGVFPSRS